jgi:hypothetical protein
MPPVVEGFLVGPEQTHAFVSPGSAVEARVGADLQITAKISGSGETNCVWSVGKGHFSAILNCTVIYLAPLEGTVDNLSVRAQSTCQTQDSVAGLSVRLALGRL